VDITAAEVLMTVGGKQALFNSALALVDPGDEVVTHAPYWPTIPEQVKLVGGVPVIVSTSSEDGFAVTADAIIAAMTPKTKAIILNSPANPTGGLIEESAVAAIADEAARRGVWVIVDLCYEQLIYETVPHNLPKVLFDRHRDKTVLAGSASKSYAMTGWRCGWTIAPKELDLDLQHHPGADHVEHRVDHAEGGAGGHRGTADRRAGDAGRVPAPPGQHPRVADGAPRHQVREAEGSVLPVPGHLGSCWRRARRPRTSPRACSRRNMSW
jgi:bifunctional pyridoxal-dependent enzyme with beta-cystathionase and maltose regulon repressor activities